MIKVNVPGQMVKLQVTVPLATYEHLNELLIVARARGTTKSGDVVVASCIDTIYELMFDKEEKK